MQNLRGIQRTCLQVSWGLPDLHGAWPGWALAAGYVQVCLCPAHPPHTSWFLGPEQDHRRAMPVIFQAIVSIAFPKTSDIVKSKVTGQGRFLQLPEAMARVWTCNRGIE